MQSVNEQSNPGSVLVPSPATAESGYAITQLTNNGDVDDRPEIDAGKVVWRSYHDFNNANNKQVFLWADGQITQISSTGAYYVFPQIDAGQVVWAADGIYLWDGTQTCQLTNTPVYTEWFPQIDAGTVVWYGYVDPWDTDIFLWNGGQITRLAHPDIDDINPQTDGSKVVWQGWDGNDYEIYFWDGTTITQVTDNAYDDQYPQIDQGKVVWQSYSDGNANSEIFLWDGGQPINLSNNTYPDYSPQIDDGIVVWAGYDGSPDQDREIYLWDGISVRRLTDNSYDDATPQIDDGMVVWVGAYSTIPSDGDWEIFLSDGAQTIQLTNNDYGDVYPQIDGGIVVWEGWNGTDSEIFMAVPNQPPVVGAITGPTAPVNIADPVNTAASFTDPDTADTHTAVWDWGDGTSTVGTVSETGGSGTVNDSHTYSAAGVYTVTLTVTDSHGASDTEMFQYVVIYNPNGGFVTGAGWFDSPPGAYAPDTSLAGKALFGFVSKYHAGATVPTGNTQFQFKVADLHFRSDSYQWLVVAGAKAQYKGTGTINAAGNFGFMLTAVDGQLLGGNQPDRFRIKIWDRDNGDTVVYDNRMGENEYGDSSTDIGGGSIVIHSQ